MTNKSHRAQIIFSVIHCAAEICACIDNYDEFSLLATHFASKGMKNKTKQCKQKSVNDTPLVDVTYKHTQTNEH